MAGPKFWTSTVLLLAFISLSAGAASAGERRCYWCGPLAEQVHRSRRSAACRGADPVAACEPGYNYCAVVATSPPRVESRFCVKLYQDECYPLFCNSTKTWKMTCPCRGDLCNGPNTERENEAFALLPKLVAKTHNAPIKKRTAFPSPHLIKHRTIIDNSDSDNDSDQNVPEKLIVNEGENPSQQDSTQSVQPNIVVEHHEEAETQSVTNQDAQTATANKQLIEIEIHVSDPTLASDKMNEVHPCTDSPTTTQPDEPEKVTETVQHKDMPVITTADTVESNEPSLKTTDNNIVDQSEAPIKTTEAIKQDAVDVETTEKAHPEPPMKTTEITQNEEPTKFVTPEDQMQNDAPIINPTDVQSIGTTEEVKVEVPKNNVKPSGETLTAEALQQNGSSASVSQKPVQATTTEATTVTTFMTTQENAVKIATTPASRRKNSGVRMTFSFVALLSCFVYL